jgi:hypothetical protein
MWNWIIIFASFQLAIASDSSENNDIKNESTELKKELVLLLVSFFVTSGIMISYWFFIGRNQDQVKQANYREVEEETRREFTIEGAEDEEEL